MFSGFTEFTKTTSIFQPLSLNPSKCIDCAAGLLHVTGVIAFPSTPLFPTHISTAMRDLSALKLRIVDLPCPLKWKIKIIYGQN